jgi:hypothetical protein
MACTFFLAQQIEAFNEYWRFPDGTRQGDFISGEPAESAHLEAR